MDVYKVLNRYLNINIRQALNNRELLDTAEENRLRQNMPIVIRKDCENFFMKNGEVCRMKDAFKPHKDEIQDTLSPMKTQILFFQQIFPIRKIRQSQEN